MSRYCWVDTGGVTAGSECLDSILSASSVHVLGMPYSMSPLSLSLSFCFFSFSNSVSREGLIFPTPGAERVDVSG